MTDSALLERLDQVLAELQGGPAIAAIDGTFPQPAAPLSDVAFLANVCLRQ
jgi:hypothetical protein